MPKINSISIRKDIIYSNPMNNRLLSFVSKYRNITNMCKNQLAYFLKLFFRKEKDETKYIVLKGKYGFGNRMQAFCAVVAYAELTKRKIIIDWRDSRYSNQKDNSFPMLFTSPVVDNSLRIPDTCSVNPKIWINFLDKEIGFLIEKFGLTKQNLRSALKFDMDHMDYDTKVVISFHSRFHFPYFRNYLSALPEDWNTESPDGLLQHLLRNYIAPVESIKKQIDDFKEKYFRNPTIGIHIRYTDNLRSNKTKVYPDTYIPVVDKLIREKPDATLFLATDNEELEEYFISRYENILTTKKSYPKSKNRPLHDPEPGADAIFLAREGIKEMYLLSECDCLVYSSVSSFAKCASLISNISKDNLFDLADLAEE